MKKLIFFLLQYVMIHTVVLAQNGFNERQTLNAQASMLTSVAEYNHLYYATGFCRDSSNPVLPGTLANRTSLKFATFDAQGNRLFDTAYLKLQRNISSVSNNLLRQADGSWLLAANETDDSGDVYLVVPQKLYNPCHY
jgi:hypothetical protein